MLKFDGYSIIATFKENVWSPKKTTHNITHYYQQGFCMNELKGCCLEEFSDIERWVCGVKGMLDRSHFFDRDGKP